MSSIDSLKDFNVTVEVSHVKNKNKKAVRELEEELICQEAGGRPVSEVGPAIAPALLNSHFRFSGLPSHKLWTFSDSQFILAKHSLRSSNHPLSKKCEKSKNPCGLVYLVSDKDKSRSRDCFIVVSTVLSTDPWCFVKKFSGSQIRASSYKVTLSECFPVPPSIVVRTLF